MTPSVLSEVPGYHFLTFPKKSAFDLIVNNMNVFPCLDVATVGTALWIERLFTSQ